MVSITHGESEDRDNALSVRPVQIGTFLEKEVSREADKLIDHR